MSKFVCSYPSICLCKHAVYCQDFPSSLLNIYNHLHAFYYHESLFEDLIILELFLKDQGLLQVEG